MRPAARRPSAAVAVLVRGELFQSGPGVQHAGEHPPRRVRVPERGVGVGSFHPDRRRPPRGDPAHPHQPPPGQAEREQGRPAPASPGARSTARTATGSRSPANTGCSTHGDFSAPMVSPPGTTGDRPAAITRISSGVSAAIASGTAASTRHRQPPGPAVLASPRPVGPSRAEDDHADEPDERHPGEPGGQRHRGAGQRQRQPPAERGHPELLHQRLKQEPLGHEPGRGRQPGQGYRPHREARAAPRRPPSHAAQRLQVVAARRGLEPGGRGEQQRLRCRVRHHLQRGGQQPDWRPAAGRRSPRRSARRRTR